MRGIDKFKERFAGHDGEYVLIGGGACDLLFDEAYYPPEAHELLTWGFEYNRGYTFIVHPPLGKWLIACGIGLFGYDSFGWRFPSAVAGTGWVRRSMYCWPTLQKLVVTQ